MKPILVIDYDDTLTALPEFWRAVLKLAASYHQRVICITQRMADEENIAEVDWWLKENEIELPVHFTNGQNKLTYLEDQGFDKYILCDNPRRAVNGV